MKVHRILTFILLIVSFAISIFGIVVGVQYLMSLEKSGIFEAVLILIANNFMMAISFFAIANTFISFKKGSTFMKGIMLDPRKNPKKKMEVLMFVISLLSLGLFIFLILIYVDVIINATFPKPLIAALISFMFLLFVLGVSFLTYPFLYKKDGDK